LHGFNRFFGVPHGNNAVPLRYTSNSTVLDESPTQADLTPRFTEEAIEFINNNKDRPFYAELAYTAAHTPFGNETYRQVIQKMDTNIGLVLDALDDAGIADDTLVIFTTDNGPALYAGPNHGSTGPLSLAAGAPDFGGKRSVYEGGIRVPFIARWPGHVPHRTVSAPAMNIDFYPTFMALAGLSIANPSQFDGKDISPVLLGTGERPGADEFLFYSMNKLRAFRSGDWKVHFDAAGRAGQLYNLATDLGEQNNLARSQPAKLQSMSARAKQLDAGLIRESPPKI
jgi:arylsulfatase